MKHRRHAFSVGTMLVGSMAVFGLVYVMNETSTPPKQQERAEKKSFQIEHKAQPKKKKSKPKPKRQRRRAHRSTRAAAPNLTSALGGVAVNAEGFSSKDFADVPDSVLGDTKKSVMTEDAVDKPARAIERVPAKYPPSARKRGITGYVKLNLLISSSGRVERTKVLESQPSGVFDTSARDAVSAWRFEPGTYQGEPVKHWAKITIRFDLAGRG